MNPHIDPYGPPFNTPATSGWARHENENGFSVGEAMALAGKPMGARSSMRGQMPNTLLNGSHADAFIDLRYQAYQEGYNSVSRYALDKYSKKEADAEAASLRRRGYRVLGISKSKGAYGGTVFTIDFTGTKRQGGASGARKVNPAKFDRCVREVEAKGGDVNAYAVCTAAGTRNPKPASQMTAGELNKALDKIDAQDSKLTQAFISAGRGNERASES